jgi:hypothetical protein
MKETSISLNHCLSCITALLVYGSLCSQDIGPAEYRSYEYTADQVESVEFSGNYFELGMGLSGNAMAGNLSDIYQFSGGVSMYCDFYFEKVWIVGTKMSFQFSQVSRKFLPDSVTDQLNTTRELVNVR